MINTAPPASYSVYGREKLFWYDKISFSNHVCHCGAVVKELLERADKPGSTLFSVSLYRFFLFSLFFLTLFFLLTFFLYSYCWPCWSYTWINIYFKLKSGVLFWKRDFKSSWSPYWPSLRPDKTISCQDMPLLWNSWIFFNVSWHYDKQHTVHHKLYWFTPNTHQWPTGEKTCLLYIVLIINIISNT